MAVGTRSRGDGESAPEPPESPDISVCESCPGRYVFIESGNTDGWLSSDTTMAITQ